MPRDDYDDTEDLIREIQRTYPKYTYEDLDKLSHAQLYRMLERLRAAQQPPEIRTNYARELRQRVVSQEEVDVQQSETEEFFTQQELEEMYGKDGIIPYMPNKTIRVIGEEGTNAELEPPEEKGYPFRFTK